MTIRLKIEQDGMILLYNTNNKNENGINIERSYGIEPSRYLEIHKKLLNKGLKIGCLETGKIIKFSLYCNELLDMDFDLSNLLCEFNASQNNYEELAHTVSLAQLCYHYTKCGFNICVNKKKKNQRNPDITINGVKCELKVRHDKTFNRMKKHQSLLETNRDKYYEIYFNNIRSLKEDLLSAINNRAEEGFKQAKCLIFDLSNHFHSWNFYRLKGNKFDWLSEKPIAPICGSIIIFSPNNAVDLNKLKFEPEAFWAKLFCKNLISKGRMDFRLMDVSNI
jgi:hypothetical protein